MKHRGLSTTIVLVLFALGAIHSAALDVRQNQRRQMLQRTRMAVQTDEEREAEREAAALAAFQRQQERKANESIVIIEQAKETAAEAVQAYLGGKFTERIDVLVNLLRNADGVAFKFVLNTLMSRGDRQTSIAIRFANRAFRVAVKEGYAANVAEAISYAFTVKENDNDHFNLLTVLLFRKEALDKNSDDDGCQFIKNLFTDADLLAEQRGDSMAFVAAFDDQEYLPLMECFLDPCTGAAAKCCGQQKALRRGTCGCPRKTQNRCDYNIFATLPRTIWICSRTDCRSNAKCLCPAKA